MQLTAVRLEIPENGNIIVGQSHFIKTVEDLYEAIVNTVPQMKFGIAFNEASGACLIRADGNDPDLGRQCPRQRHRHRVNSGLGGGIGDVAAAAAHTRHRADIDDEAVPARLEQRLAGAHHREGAAQIHRQHDVEEIVVKSA